MTTDDAVKILEAVGDSWPAAIVAVSLVFGVIAWRALPRLREIVAVMKDVAPHPRPEDGSGGEEGVSPCSNLRSRYVSNKRSKRILSYLHYLVTLTTL